MLINCLNVVDSPCPRGVAKPTVKYIPESQLRGAIAHLRLEARPSYLTK